MTEQIDCATRLQATARALLKAGADRPSILDALISTAVQLVSEDPDDPEWVRLIDAAQSLLEKVQIHRRPKKNILDWDT